MTSCRSGKGEEQIAAANVVDAEDFFAEFDARTSNERCCMMRIRFSRQGRRRLSASEKSLSRSVSIREQPTRVLRQFADRHPAAGRLSAGGQRRLRRWRVVRRFVSGDYIIDLPRSRPDGIQFPISGTAASSRLISTRTKARTFPDDGLGSETEIKPGEPSAAIQPLVIRSFKLSILARPAKFGRDRMKRFADIKSPAVARRRAWSTLRRSAWLTSHS